MKSEHSFCIPPELCSHYGFNNDPLPNFILSKFGTEIALRIGDQWSREIIFYNPGIGNIKIKWGEEFNQHPLIEYSARLFLIEELKTKSHLYGHRLFADLIGGLSIDPLLSKTKTQKCITNWIVSQAIESFGTNEALYSCLVNYANFCVEEEYWGFGESLLWQLSSARLPKRASRSKKFNDSMLDPVHGPYNQQEVIAITNALAIKNLSTKDRALILLCRDISPRPVQLALMQETDLISDIRGDYLRIPRVKGYKRSALRRANGNYTERALSEELAHELNTLKESNQAAFERLDAELERHCGSQQIPFTPPPRPLFPRTAGPEVSFALYLDKGSRIYTYHLTAAQISRHIRKLTEKLQLQRPENLETGYLEIGAYRFRRTKATSMAIQGYTPEDVAYALDHSSISSVSHYFRFSRDLIDFVNLATSSNVDINQMVTAWTGQFAKEKKPGKEVRLNQIDTIGVCLSSQACEYHPIVTCYSCPKFRAYRDGDHSKALTIIISLKEALEEDSSGPVKGQLDAAIAMASECIKAQNEEDY